jgi:hypothetical protein
MVELDGGACGRRWVQAALYELAAELERAIAATPEGWVVGTRYMTDGHGFVFVELMDGSPAEVRRATAVLEPLAGTAPTGKSAGRRPGRTRQVGAAPVPDRTAEGTVEAAQAGVTAAASEPEGEAAVPDDGVPAAPDVADESEGRARRRKRQRYREAAGHAAGDFEREQLSGDAGQLPECARAALGGGPKSGAYWDWLLEQWRHATPAAADGAS